MNITIQVGTDRVGESAYIVTLLEKLIAHLSNGPVPFEDAERPNIHRVEWDDIGGEEIVTLNELARRLGISPQWMRELAKKPGFPVSYNQQRRSSVSVREAIQWLKEYGPPAKTRRTAHVPIYPDITAKEGSADAASSPGPSLDESLHQESDHAPMA